jgi:hypothetical protein
LRQGDWRLTAQVAQNRMVERQMVAVRLDMLRVHLFDGATGIRLGKGSPDG